MYTAPDKTTGLEARLPPSPNRARDGVSSTFTVPMLGSDSVPPLAYSSPSHSGGRPETNGLTPAGTSPIQTSYSGDSSLSRSQPTSGRERDVNLRTTVRDRPPYGEGGCATLLDDGSDSLGPSPGMRSYSGDTDRAEIIAADPAPGLQSFWGFEEMPNPPAAPGPLGLQEACLIHCFIQKLATTVSL
jgi:hypothetical protein